MINEQIRVIGLKIRNFRGIEDLSVAVEPGGTVFAGRNRAGKTSALKAIRAALEAEGIGPDAIRRGADEAEIFVDLGVVTACRTIKQRSTSLEVRDQDGTILPKPTAQLKELLGAADLDPLAFYLADAKERRRLIMAAMPAKVTVEDLNRWCGTEKAWNVDGHGQEVLARVRESYYSQRTEANKAVDDAKARYNLAAESASTADLSAKTITPEAARTVVESRARDLAVLKDRRTQAAELDARSDAFRSQIAGLRKQAEDLVAATPVLAKLEAKNELESAGQRRSSDNDAVVSARAALEQAEKSLKDSDEDVLVWKRRLAEIEKAEFDADSLVKEANDREAALEKLQAGQTSESLTEQILMAEGDLTAAQMDVTAAERYAAACRALAAKETAKAELERVKGQAERLDAIVTRLTKDAPAELAKRANLIPGLEVTASAIMLDGVSLDERSGAEQMRFAVDLAKRLSARARILVVDGLERVDPDEQPKFIELARAGGWQLFGSLVQAGELCVIHLNDDGKEMPSNYRLDAPKGHRAKGNDGARGGQGN